MGRRVVKDGRKTGAVFAPRSLRTASLHGGLKGVFEGRARCSSPGKTSGGAHPLRKSFQFRSRFFKYRIRYKILIMSSAKNKFVGFAIEAHKSTAQEMLDERPHRNAMLRLALVGVYKTMSVPIVGQVERYLGAEFFGIGGEQIAFRKSGEVVKILRATTGLPKETAAEEAKSYQKLSDIAQSFIGNRWVDTTFSAEKMPRVIGGYAVVAAQPEVNPIKSLQSPEELLSYPVSSELLRHLGDIVESIKELHCVTGMYPDLFGPGNVLMVGPQGSEDLSIVDTIPETPGKLEMAMGPDRGGISRRQAHHEAIGTWGDFARSNLERYESPAVVFH